MTQEAAEWLVGPPVNGVKAANCSTSEKEAEQLESSQHRKDSGCRETRKSKELRLEDPGKKGCRLWTQSCQVFGVLRSEMLSNAIISLGS